MIVGFRCSNQLRLQVFDTREAFLEVLGKFLEQSKLGDAHGLRRVAESILDDDLILRLAQNQTDARLIAGMPQQVVDG